MSSHTSNASSALSVIIHGNNTAAPAHRYEPGGYHPVVAGEVYNHRYRVIRKLGWGIYSTVWLVQDIQFVFDFGRISQVHFLSREQRLAAMKILIGDLSTASKRGGWDEPGILKVLQKTNPHSSGYGHICHLLESFIHQGPNGNHICLVLEAMRLSALDLYGALPGAMPLGLLKRMCKHVLPALQYLHEECGIIHTGKMFPFIRSCLFLQHSLQISRVITYLCLVFPLRKSGWLSNWTVPV